GQVAGEVGDDRDRQVLYRPGGGAADGRRHAGGSVRRDDHARRAGTLRAPADGAEVVRVADLVEADEQRPLAPGEGVGVGVAEGIAPGEDALVVARTRRLAQLPL